MKLPTTFRQQLATFFGLAIGGWIAYLLVFQHFFPNNYNPNESRVVFWVWLICATAVFVAIELGAFRILATPPPWRPSLAIAGIAPAIVLDCLATTFFSNWFASSGSYEATAYSATVLGGSGVMLLLALYQGAKPTT